MEQTLKRHAPVLKGLVFAAFILAGYVKADPRLSWMPVDVTLLFGALSFVLAVISWWRGGFRIPAPFWWALLLFLLCAIPLFWTVWTPYAAEKAFRFFTITLLAFLLPFFLFRDPRDLYGLFLGLVVISCVLAVDASVLLLRSLSDHTTIYRLKTPGTDTIEFGRATGLAALFFFFRSMERRVNIFFALLALCTLVILMFASGSRGPLIAFVLTCALCGVVFHMGRASELLRYLGFTGAVVCAIGVAVLVAPSSSRERIETFFSGSVMADYSTIYRAQAATLTASEINASPIGSGWAGSAPALSGLRDVNKMGMRYPHNIVLEILAEAGWLTGIYLLLLVVYALTRLGISGRRTDRIGYRLPFALLCFGFLNTLTSGDLNGNRLFFALLSGGMAMLSQTAWMSGK